MSPFENEGAATAATQEPEAPASETGAEAPQTDSLGEPFGTSDGVPSADGDEGTASAEQPAATAEPIAGLSEPEAAATEEPAGKVVETVAEVEAEGGDLNTPLVRTFAAGTKLQFGSSTVTLVEDTVVTYDEAGNEQHFAATCQMTGNYEVNAPFLQNQYDLNGRMIEG